MIHLHLSALHERRGTAQIQRSQVSLLRLHRRRARGWNGWLSESSLLICRPASPQLTLSCSQHPGGPRNLFSGSLDGSLGHSPHDEPHKYLSSWFGARGESWLAPVVVGEGWHTWVWPAGGQLCGLSPEPLHSSCPQADATSNEWMVGQS